MIKGAVCEVDVIARENISTAGVRGRATCKDASRVGQSGYVRWPGRGVTGGGSFACSDDVDDRARESASVRSGERPKQSQPWPLPGIH